MTNETYQRFVERYETGQLPWNDELPPPEVIALVPKLEPGRALDLGCGYGRTAIYLAKHGWMADGIDYVPAAIAGAQQRAADAGLAAQVNFYEGSASSPDMLTGPYDLAIDIGCMHSFPDEELVEYRDSLKRLLRPGAIYLLFAHVRNEKLEEGERPHGIMAGRIDSLFADGFRQDHIEVGTTQVEDRDPWRSAWVWFTRI
ncbi:MAG: class I SAM-dependent methyltransferase [Anaerolineae bacterium]